MDDSVTKEMIFNIIVRVMSLENLLVKKNIVTNNEIMKEIEKVSEVLVKTISDKMLEQAFQGNQVDQLISDLSNKKDTKLN